MIWRKRPGLEAGNPKDRLDQPWDFLEPFREIFEFLGGKQGGAIVAGDFGLGYGEEAQSRRFFLPTLHISTEIWISWKISRISSLDKNMLDNKAPSRLSGACTVLFPEHLLQHIFGAMHDGSSSYHERYEKFPTSPINPRDFIVIPALSVRGNNWGVYLYSVCLSLSVCPSVVVSFCPSSVCPSNLSVCLSVFLSLSYRWARYIPHDP